MVFTATTRLILGSRALYTTPMAPRPSSARISYRPKRSLLRSSISDTCSFSGFHGKVIVIAGLNVPEFSRHVRRGGMHSCVSGRRTAALTHNCVPALRRNQVTDVLPMGNFGLRPGTEKG